jgi:hypothetical protein
MPKHEPEVIAAAQPNNVVPGNEQILNCSECGYQLPDYGRNYSFRAGKESSTYVWLCCEHCGEATEFDLATIDD